MCIPVILMEDFDKLFHLLKQVEQLTNHIRVQFKFKCVFKWDKEFIIAALLVKWTYWLHKRDLNFIIKDLNKIS